MGNRPEGNRRGGLEAGDKSYLVLAGNEVVFQGSDLGEAFSFSRGFGDATRLMVARPLLPRVLHEAAATQN